MTTFPRGHHAYLARQENAKFIAKLDREPSPRPAASMRFEFADPVDLRGIPALARGVGGTIRGTQPENAATR